MKLKVSRVVYKVSNDDLFSIRTFDKVADAIKFINSYTHSDEYMEECIDRLESDVDFEEKITRHYTLNNAVVTVTQHYPTITEEYIYEYV